MAHALVAKANSMPVEGITLWMFGGVSRLGGEAPDGRTELRMAVVGPLTSLVFGIVMLAAAAALAAVDGPEVAVTAVAWLGLMNVALAVFNMLPAYPLDGGRVLRAVLWRRTGDQRRATRIASGIGVVLVADVMTPDPVTAPSGLTVEALVNDLVVGHRCSAFPVVRADGTPVGLVTLSGVRHVPAEARASTVVDQVATPLAQVVTARPDDPMLELLEQLTPGTGRRALVLDTDDALVGIVTASDVERAIEVAQLRGTPLLGAERSTSGDAGDPVRRG
jgi:CBS domain-containing protein